MTLVDLRLCEILKVNLRDHGRQHEVGGIRVEAKKTV